MVGRQNTALAAVSTQRGQGDLALSGIFSYIPVKLDYSDLQCVLSSTTFRL